MVRKPTKTLADYMVIGISPVLVMLLVGSLSFFLTEVFYRGAAVASVRWVLFWFVLAVVLVSRMGIEQGASLRGDLWLGPGRRHVAVSGVRSPGRAGGRRLAGNCLVERPQTHVGLHLD